MTSGTVSQATPLQQTTRTRHASARRAWVITGLALLVLLAGAVRGLSYARYLPVFEHIDESFRFIHAYQLRDDAPLGDQYGEIEWARGFPPLQPWVAIWTQRLVESRVPFPYPPDYVRALRGLSAALNVGTTVLVAAAGYRLARAHGPGIAAWAGLLAALPWAVAPRVVGTGNLALMDPLIFPAVAVALLAAVISIQDDSAPAALVSLLAVIAAIYLKYLLIYALWLPFCAVAALVWRRRWHALPWIAVMGVVSAATAGWLVFVHRALELDNTESQTFYQDGLANMFSVARNADNLAYTLSESIGIWVFAVTLAGGVVAGVLARRRGAQTLDVRWLALLLPYMLANLMLTSSVDILRTWEPYWFRVRYTLPTAIGLMLVWAGCAVQVVCWLRTTRARRWAGVVPVALALWVAVPSVGTHLTAARAWAQPHTLERIWQYADPSLPADGVFLLAERGDLHAAWNRPWSGYNGQTAFRWEFTNTPHDRPPSEWAADGFAYFAATAHDMQTIYTDPAMTPWVAQLYPLKTIPGGVGIETVSTFYRMLPPDVTTEVVFGSGLALVGYDLSAATVAPGDVLTFRPYWQAAATPPPNLSLFVHLRPVEAAAPVAQYDGPPAADRRPPTTWTDPAETVVGAVGSLAVPPELTPGDYTLAVGLYDFTTGVRLPLANGADALTIPVTVQ